MNGKAHSVELDNGMKCTAWNDKVDCGRLMQAYASHEELELEIKPYTSKTTGKTGFNIVAIKGTVPELKPETQAIVDRVGSGVGNQNLMSAKDVSIVSQVCIKGAVELAKEFKFTNNDELGAYLCMASTELAAVYKLTVSKLE